MTARPTLPALDADLAADDAAWCQLAAQIGRAVAQPLSSALERVLHASATGRIDGEGLRALKAEIEQARNVGMLSQRLARIASGDSRQSHERLDLGQTLAAVLAERGPALEVRGVHLRRSAKAVDVLVDPALLAGLLDALLDWALAAARSSIQLRVDLKSWPVYGHIHCSLAREPGDADDDEARLDSLDWQLVVRIARSMGLQLQRSVDPQQLCVSLEFPRTVNEQLEGLSAIEIDVGDRSSLNSKPLAGSHVLVIAGRRDRRLEVRRALADMGLLVDFVASVDEAAEFCRDEPPHAIVFEAVLRNERLDQLAGALRRGMHGLALIEIAEEGHAFEISGFNGMTHARIGRDGLLQTLPSALVFEMAKGY